MVTDAGATTHDDRATTHDGAPADPACALARGEQADPSDGRRLVAVFDSPVAGHLLHFARDCGWGTTLLEPRGSDAATHAAGYADVLLTATDVRQFDENMDVVVTDHDREELGEIVRDLLAAHPRWVGVMGSPRHAAPHVPALRELGVPDETIARVHRPIGLNIGSRSPAEIALATLAGLIADRRDRPGGFEFG
ncbi:MAG: XdhC family protein [Nocardioidaceae bacterium]